MKLTHYLNFCFVLVCLIAAAAIVPSVRADSPEFHPPVQSGQIMLAAMDEISGLAPSLNNPGLLWMHNDHGDSPRVYAVETDGTFRGIYNFSGAENVDWEDMAVGPGPLADTNYLYMGDVGNNDFIRGTVADPLTIYRTPEPTIAPGTSPFQKNIYQFETINLTYPLGQSYNSEAIFVDPISADLFVITRESNTSRLFRASADDMLDGYAALTFAAYINMHKPTAADVSVDGDEIIMRGENEAVLWQRDIDEDLAFAFSQPPVAIPLANEFNGEAIGFDYTGDHYFTTTEGLNAPIHFYERVITYIPIPGDINNDGEVGLLDLDILGSNFGRTDASPQQGDLNGDREVGLLDLDILGSNYGRTAVPEPASLSLLLICATLLRRSGCARH